MTRPAPRSAREILSLFGPEREAAQALGVSPGWVRRCKTYNYIPFTRGMEVLAAAERLGLDVDREELIALARNGPFPSTNSTKKSAA